MKTQTSEKQMEANRRNALKSTGPKTEAGRERSRRNAVKHGIFSREVVVSGGSWPESGEEFEELHARFVEDLQPAGVVEELLVDQVVRAHWRLRRALAAEAGEVAQSLARAQQGRGQRSLGLMSKGWGLSGNPERTMRACTEGNVLLGTKLLDLLLSVQTNGQLTAAAVQAVNVAGQPLELTRELEALRVRLLGNPEGLEGEALRRWRKQQALERIDHELAVVKEGHDACQRREAQEEEARLAAARLPAEAVLEKIVRYERMLERQIERGLGMLEKRRKVQDPKLKIQRREGTNGRERTDGTDGDLRNEAKGSGEEFQISDFESQSERDGGGGKEERPQRFREDKDEGHAGSGTGAPVGRAALNQESEEVSKMGSEKWGRGEQRADAGLMAADAPSLRPSPPMREKRGAEGRDAEKCDGANGTEGTNGELRNEANLGSGEESQIGDFRFQTEQGRTLEQGREEEASAGERTQRFREDKDGGRAGSKAGAPQASTT